MNFEGKDGKENASTEAARFRAKADSVNGRYCMSRHGMPV